MSNKTLIWISLGTSLISLVVSVIVLVNYCPTQNLQFDYMGVIVGILALLVTALIGAQVGQYVFVDRKIESISKPITRIILDYLNRVCDESKEHGGARVLVGRKQYYESKLDKLNQDVSQIKNYLAEAKEMPIDTDEKIREENINSSFKV